MHAMKIRTPQRGDNTLERVKHALHSSGYLDDSLLTATFVKFNDSGKEVHVVTYIDEDEGGLQSSFVYVWRKSFSVFGGEYLQADY